MREKREISRYTLKIKHLNFFQFTVYGIESLVLNFQVMLSNEVFGFNKIQHEKSKGIFLEFCWIPGGKYQSTKFQINQLTITLFSGSMQKSPPSSWKNLKMP